MTATVEMLNRETHAVDLKLQHGMFRPLPWPSSVILEQLDV